MSDITQILSQIERGDPTNADQLLPLVYDELRKLAAARLAHEKPGQTLSATALVHEAYLRLSDSTEHRHWNSRGHFFAAAAEAMRRIVVENARRKGSQKRGAEHRRIELAELPASERGESLDLLALNDALSRLEAEEPQKAALVKLRFFAGLTIDEAAAVLGISRATAKRHWVYARAWLFGRLKDE